MRELHKHPGSTGSEGAVTRPLDTCTASHGSGASARATPFPASRAPCARVAGTRGFTLVELIASVGVFAIGVTGVVALQHATTESNATAREMVVASEIAQAWASELAADGQRWRAAAQGTVPTGTVWLHRIEDTPDWFQPVWDATAAFGPYFNALGAPLADASGNPNDPSAGLRYCTKLRLNWLRQPDPLNPGNALIRADIEVFWPRHHPQDTAASRGNFCVDAPTRAGFHIVTLTTNVRKEVTR